MNIVAMALCLSFSAPVVHPVFPPAYGQSQEESLKGQVAAALKLSPQELFDLTPTRSGLYFCGCPNCNGGSQEGAMSWAFGMGDTVKCRFCGMVFPNEKFPADHEVVITAPSGARQVYRYHQDSKGTQYFFEARAWFARCAWIQQMALKLANLYALTGDPAYGDRAAAIVGRFAQVFPDYAVRFDYPFQAKRFFPANQKWPYKGISEFRGAKFYWWAYCDISADLAQAYDLLAAGDAFERMKDLLGTDIRAKIETDLIRMAYDFTAANPDSYTNMSSGTYHDMIVAGRVIGAPEMVHEAVNRFQTLVKQKFFFDGWWCEGTPSYHQQTIGHLQTVLKVAKGYSDPPDWTGDKFVDLDLGKDTPLLTKAIEVNAEACFPNGHVIPINDTWAFDTRKPTDSAVSRLWPGLGHAMLGAGAGPNQFQAHLNWSGAFGHSHADNNSMILYAFGKEMLSDLGYTHTRYRNWTINSASHNLVVVDAKSQKLGSKSEPTTGNALFYDDGNPHVRVVAADCHTSYAQCPVYARRLVCVHVDEGKDYVVDWFDVEGGTYHDYFLHGSADEEGTFEIDAPITEDVASLVPDWGGKNEPDGENCYDLKGDKFHPYWFLWQVKSVPAPESLCATWHYRSAGLRTHLFCEGKTTAYTFVSPAVRGAKDDDAKLHDFLRHGLMLRHEGGKSRFVAVHEPFATTPWLDAVQFNDGTFTVTHGDGQETILWKGDRITVKSSAGWSYDSGEPMTGTIQALDRADSFVLESDRELPSIHYVNLDFGNHRRVIYPVQHVEKNRIVLSGDPGFQYDAGAAAAEFLDFPQEVFKGPIAFSCFSITQNE